MPDLTVWPTDGADGSVSSEARWRKMARGWVPSGVDQTALGIAGGAGALAPTLVAGPTINVAIGGCWLDGHYAELTAPASVPATANGLLVVRFTPADNHAELLWRDAATLPPTQTLATWELALASMAAGAITDRRVGWRTGSPPCYPNYATLKALWPGTGAASPAAGTVPPDGYQAVTLDDGRIWTFRAASLVQGGITSPVNRWETTAYANITANTDAGAITNVAPSQLGLDGFQACVGQANWDAVAAPNTALGGWGRMVSATNFQFRAWNTSAGSIALKVSYTGMGFTVWAIGWRV